MKKSKCEIVASVTCRGDQVHAAVRAHTRETGQHGYPVIVARIGNQLIYWEDAESLLQWRDVILAAASYVDDVFPDEAPKPYRPVKGRRA